MKKIISFLLLTGLACAVSAAPVFFENGKTGWKIRTPENPAPAVRYAAEELQSALKKISGAEFPITTLPGKPEIVIDTDTALSDPATVSLKTDADTLYLTGGSPSAALHAVYSFLQRELGVRWLWPGNSGEFMPEKSAWQLPALDYQYKPEIKYRGFHLCCDWRDVQNFRVWMARNFINIFRHGHSQYNKLGFHFMISSHNVTLPAELFSTHPEYFAEIKGKHYKSQPCYSKPEVDDIIFKQFCDTVEKQPELEILSAFPPDDLDYCQCAKCAAKGTSTAWFDFYNRLTDRLKERFPNLKFATIAYQGYIDVPANPVRNSEFVEYATYARCNLHTFADNCERNRNMMDELKKWEKTGVTMGNYGYEFDVFSIGQSLSLPFFSMIDDAIKTGVRLNHTAMITEVPLAPKGGPDIQALAVKNRLPLYLYARLLWEPQADMRELLKDWCKIAYGAAAEPMFDYFMTLDQHWGALKQHRTILGSPVETAKELMTPELQRKAGECFARAAQSLGNATNPNVEREKELFNQWLALLKFDDEIILPRLSDPAAFASVSAPVPGTGVRMAWSADALRFGDAKPPCRIVLNSGVGGETWYFEIDAAGQKKSWKISEVGIRDDRWAPAWSFANGHIDIPFASLGRTPQANEIWNIRVAAGGVEFPTAEGILAALRFSASTSAPRSVIWWNGAPDREEKNNARIQSEFSQQGWRMDIAATGPELLKETPSVYWFKHPNGTNKVPAECWEKIREQVKNGATAVFVSYWQMPLEQYFANDTFKIQVKGIKDLPLTERRARDLAPGNWYAKPHNLTWRRRITPAYGVEPASPDSWKIIATMDLDGKTPGVRIPFLLARPYGKGTVFVLGDNIAAPPVKLLENLCEHKDALLK
jgi:hypothetical protein